MSSASASDLLRTLAPAEATPEPVDGCDVCTHAISRHDHTAARYCDATQANALSRRCICQPVRTSR